MRDTGTVRCVGGPADGQVVTVERWNAVPPSQLFVTRVEGGWTVLGTDPAVLDAAGNRDAWQVYERSGDGQGGWLFLHQAE